MFHMKHRATPHTPSGAGSAWFSRLRCGRSSLPSSLSRPCCVVRPRSRRAPRLRPDWLRCGAGRWALIARCGRSSSLRPSALVARSSVLACLVRKRPHCPRKPSGWAKSAPRPPRSARGGKPARSRPPSVARESPAISPHAPKRHATR